MIRQNIKSQEYFNNYFETYNKQVENRKILLDSGQVKPERIVWFNKASLDILLNYVISKYTSGAPVENLKTIFLQIPNLLSQFWSTEVVLLKYEGRTLYQYGLSTYDEMLWILSLGYLFNIPELDFRKCVKIIDRDQVKDHLLEFIIRSKLNDRPVIEEESYEYGWKLFGKLRQSIVEPDKLKAEKLVKEFIAKDWYKEHRNTGWYNNHKSIHNTYFGYWSFETAAVVKIMGLDDTSFKDCIYYPYDLVHWNDNLNNNSDDL